MPAVASLLMFFWSGSDAGAAQFIGIIFAEEDVPLFAAFQNFFFLRGDLLADFHFDLFFLAKNVGHGLDHVLADGIAVLDKFDFIALDQQVHDLVRDTHDFFAGQSHSVLSLPSATSDALPVNLTQNQFAVARQLALHLLEHFLIRDTRAAHLVLVLGQNRAYFFVDFVLYGDLFHHPVAHPLDHRVDVFFFDRHLLVFDKFLDHLRGHVAHIISVQQHLGDIPLKDCKTMSLMAARNFRNQSGHSQNNGARTKSRLIQDSLTVGSSSCSMEQCEQWAVSSVG